MKTGKLGVVGLVTLAAVWWSAGRVAAFEFSQGDMVITFNPFIDLSVSYDSNPRFSTGGTLATTNMAEHSDVYEQVELGGVVDILYRELNIKLAGITYTRTYNKAEGDYNSLSGGESVDVTYGRRESLLIKAQQSFQRLYDYTQLPNAGSDVAQPAYSQNYLQAQTWPERTQRDEFGYGFGLGRDLTDKIVADIDFAYVDSKFADASLLSTWRETFDGSLGYRVTDKSTAAIAGSYGIENSDGYLDNGSFFTIGPSWTTRMTEKVTLNGSMGYEHYESGTLTTSDTKIKTDSLFFDVGASWTPIEYWKISVQGSRGTESGLVVSGTDESTLLGVTISHEIASDINASVGVSHRWDRYTPNAADVPLALPTDSTSYSAGVTYLPFRRLSLYFNLNYIDYHCNIPAFNNNELTATLGGRLTL